MNNQKLAEAKDKVTELVAKAKTKAVEFYYKHPVACTSVITGVAAFAIGKATGYLGAKNEQLRGGCLEAMRGTAEYYDLIDDLKFRDSSTGERFATNLDSKSKEVVVLATLIDNLLDAQHKPLYAAREDGTGIDGVVINCEVVGKMYGYGAKD